MPEQLGEAIAAVAALLALETADLSGEEAALSTEGFSRLVRLGEAGTALCGKVVAEAGSYECLGHPSAESCLCELAGRPAGAARLLLETAGRHQQLGDLGLGGVGLHRERHSWAGSAWSHASPARQTPDAPFNNPPSPAYLEEGGFPQGPRMC